MGQDPQVWPQYHLHREISQGLGFRVEGLGRYGSFPIQGVPYFGVLIIRILLFRVLYSGPPISETPILPENLNPEAARFRELDC